MPDLVLENCDRGCIVSVFSDFFFSLLVLGSALPPMTLSTPLSGVSSALTQQHGPTDLSHWQPHSLGSSSSPVVNFVSQVTWIRTESSIPAARRAELAEANSAAVHDVHEVFLTIQRKITRFTGNRDFWERAAMSRRIGRVNVVPVEPDMRNTVSKEQKSEWELPYGPSMRAVYVKASVEAGDGDSSLAGRSAVVEFDAVFNSRLVKPLWLLRMKTRSPE